MRMLPITVCILVFTCGCATKPENIKPNFYPTASYQNFTCEQVALEAMRLNTAYSYAFEQQRHARREDTWGVILVGLPISSITGGSVKTQIADLKGQIAAITIVSQQKGCPPLPANS